jgi:hypothetical protein
LKVRFGTSHNAFDGSPAEEYKGVGGRNAVQPRPEYYRQLAKHCRKLAGDISDADAKAHMLDVARQYDNLAKEVETKPRQGRRIGN